MGDLDLLKKQHSEVLATIQNIETFMKDGPEIKATEIAYNINALSGKLKMHLMSEDQFLYPALMNSDNQTIRDTAQSFQKEMGNLASLFSSFVQQYNTPFKITPHKDAFTADAQDIFKLIKDRTHREDSELYPLLKG